MKAYELAPLEGFDAVRMIERPVPEVGPHDALVQIHAVSLNHRDLVYARAAAERKKAMVPGSDGAGEVVAVGASVTGLVAGDRVAGAFFPTWMDGDLSDQAHAHALGGTIDGMLAEQVVLDEQAWVKFPGYLSYEQAATLPCAGVTAWNALFEAATLRPGDTVLVQGSGGVSVFALQLARSAGAQVIATSSSARKRERLAALGAVATIDYNATLKWGEAARALTGGRGVDVVVEVGGPGTFDQSVAALRYGGTMSLIGVLTGTAGPVNTYAVVRRAIRVHGVYVGSVRMFQNLNRALEVTRIEPVIDRTFPFDEVRTAYEYMASGAHFGKIVISLS